MVARTKETNMRSQTPPRLGWVLVLTSTAFFMIALDALVVMVALPRIEHDLQVGVAGLQWTVNAYNIALAAGIVGAATLGDRFGRRRLFVVGLVLFSAASAACALAPTAGLLIAARTVQGLGGAIVMPLSLTILTGAFPIEQRARVVGIYGGLAGLAVAGGPLIGGAVTEGLDWHWIFWFNVPIGIVAGLLSLRLLPESRGPRVPVDGAGIALVTAGVVGIVWGLTRANDVGWTAAETLASLVAGAAALAGFVAWEARAAAPMLPLRLLRIRAFAAGNAAGFLSSGSIQAGALLSTQYFQLGLGYSPLETGVRLLPFFLTPFFVAPLAGAVSDRLGVRPVIALGVLLQGAGFAFVAFAASLEPSYIELVLALLVAGVGISMTLPTVPTAVLSAVEPAEMGMASGVNTMMQRFGAVFGIAAGVAVFSAYGGLDSAAEVTAGFRPAVGVVAAGFALAALLVAPLLGARARAIGEPAAVAA
jgi:EmrB/QacA subfamily drug resistance transporter